MLAMSDEIHDWLADLRGTDQLIADHVVYALAALMKQGADLADPLVVSTQDAWPSALAQELDRRYSEMLEKMQEARRRAASHPADAATHERVQRLQAKVDARRIRKEVLKARYVAAHSTLLIDRSFDEGGESIKAAETDLRSVTAEMERELGQQAWPDGLMEMRPGAPGDIGIRVLFAIEPPGTELLLSVLEGSEAVRDHHGQAIVLSADILRRVRAGEEPEAQARRYESLSAFMAEFQARDEDG
jgi:hypothetical protein